MIRFLLIPEQEMPYVQQFCPSCCILYRNNGALSPHQPIELECGHVFCISSVYQQVDLAMDPLLTCKECHRPPKDWISVLESGWDDLFWHLERARRLQETRASDSGVGQASGEMNAFNVQHGTDYSLSELGNALQSMNLQRRTSTSIEEILGQFKNMGFSGSR